MVRKAAKVVRKVERTREGKTPLRAKAATKAKQSTSAIFLSGRGGMLGRDGGEGRLMTMLGTSTSL